MKLIYLALLVLPAALLCFGNANILARAEEDELDDVVDIEGEDSQVVGDDALGDEDDSAVKSSQDVDTTILFSKPITMLGDNAFDLQAGFPVEFLVGFINKGSEDYVVETMEASFRYPMDYTYYIQNFTAIPYHREVKPKQEATFAYSFIPNEAFAGRPFGLNVQLNYRDASGNFYQDSVYNQTVNIVEVSEGLDGETFFLYVFLGAACVLALVAGQQALSSLARRRVPRAASSKPLETGTANDVDYEWLPKEVVNQLSEYHSSCVLVCMLALVAGQQALSSLARRRVPRAASSKPLETGTANDVDYEWLPKEVVNQLSEYHSSCVLVCMLALVAGQQALSSLARRRVPRAASSKPLETGTANDVDYEWLPKEVVNQLKKSPKTPKQSPRMRKAKRSAGDD